VCSRRVGRDADCTPPPKNRQAATRQAKNTHLGRFSRKSPPVPLAPPGPGDGGRGSGGTPSRDRSMSLSRHPSPSPRLASPRATMRSPFDLIPGRDGAAERGVVVPPLLLDRRWMPRRGDGIIPQRSVAPHHTTRPDSTGTDERSTDSTPTRPPACSAPKTYHSDERERIGILVLVLRAILGREDNDGIRDLYSENLRHKMKRALSATVRDVCGRGIDKNRRRKATGARRDEAIISPS